MIRPCASASCIDRGGIPLCLPGLNRPFADLYFGGSCACRSGGNLHGPVLPVHSDVIRSVASLAVIVSSFVQWWRPCVRSSLAE